MKKASVLLVAIALALFGLAACGDDDDDDDGGEETAVEVTTETEAAGGGGAGGTVEITSPDSGLAFEQDSLNAPAGTITINYENPQDLSHDVKIESEDGEELGGTELVSGGAATATVELEPGSYTFFCSVPGHREGGMEGTLTVK